MSKAKGEAAPSGAAARAETNGKPKVLETHGLKLTLPAKLPFAALQHLGDTTHVQDIVGLLKTLLGDEQLQKVWGLELDLDEGKDFVAEVIALYGTTPGESPASPTS